MDNGMIDRNDADRDAGSNEERGVRRLLEAAAARPDELPSLPPFLAHRARAEALARLREGGTRPIGFLAWRLLPAFVALAVVLSAWAGVETTRANRESESLVAALGVPQASAGDVLLGVALLGGDPIEADGGEL